MPRRMFLERRTYRQNRLQDAARLLPFLGAIMIFGPVFIRDEEGGAPTLAGELVYYFAIWLGLIVLTAVISRALVRSVGGEGETSAPPSPALPPTDKTADQTPAATSERS
ncbi:hypothetical protein [Gymnodinialimonas ceratoperidinii]|uniref:Uncharacterized protein n=1 Tax=Gymnodinialimonas ceratoperidinii TaxID=2856823 RepID=A0A8F6TUS4_9RHOB|nr:hypothetical protein [Gymnodinialimonas ceratoperidinii]QXT38086.1 hypothetical protein KYE46_08940 [Gymnodinialimonas ceratoperidinii]